MSKLTIEDLNYAANFIEMAISESYDSEFPESVASIKRVIAFLDKEREKRELAQREYAMKKAYAVENGISISQVRIVKKGA
jgi:hypothetical protein